MRYADLVLPEFDQEMASTRKVIERVPADKLEWRAHVKSNTIGWVANHLAEIVGWVEGTFQALTWDLDPVDGVPYASPALTSTEAILELFDKNVASARSTIETVTEAQLADTWSLTKRGEVLMSMPRSVVMRTFVLNHIVHHRAILCVYLRLNDLPVPGLYGPSGDEPSGDEPSGDET